MLATGDAPRHLASKCWRPGPRVVAARYMERQKVLMRTRTQKKHGCVIRSIAALAVLLLITCGGLGIATQLIVRQAEARYPATAFVTLEETRLHYASEGSGSPVVFIHGGNGQLQDFTLSPVFGPVAAEFHAIAVDRPGLGYSEKPVNEDMTPDVQARLLREALEELGVERPLLVGQSWGGVVVLAYALDYPESVSGLVLMGVAPYPRERATDPFWAVARVPVIGDVLVRTVFVPTGHYLLSPVLLKQSAGSFAPLDKVPPSFYDTNIALGLRPKQILSAAEESVVIPASLESLSERLREITVPVTVLVGELDTHAVEQAEQLKRDITGSIVVVVDGANHHFWYAYPQVVVEAIQSTWDRVEEE